MTESKALGELRKALPPPPKLCQLQQERHPRQTRTLESRQSKDPPNLRRQAHLWNLGEKTTTTPPHVISPLLKSVKRRCLDHHRRHHHHLRQPRCAPQDQSQFLFFPCLRQRSPGNAKKEPSAPQSEDVFLSQAATKGTRLGDEVRAWKINTWSKLLFPFERQPLQMHVTACLMRRTANPYFSDWPGPSSQEFRDANVPFVRACFWN